jgi:bifunctional ADP-heptose synthase (sugar kinase/adenylyltransferase)
MAKILVIGESCLDEFVYCDAERLAPDLPIPILKVKEVRQNPGMAMNVLRNIQNYVPDATILTNSNWMSVKKTRYVDFNTNHSFIRIDTQDQVTEMVLEINLSEYDLVVVSDYNKGYMDESAILKITEMHPRVFLDTKKILGHWAEKALFIKINDFEFRNSFKHIDEKLKGKIIHTRGSLGCEFQGKNFPVKPVEVKDSSGAGDSFMAALVIEYLRTEDIEKSILHANKMAARVVSERGVTLI